MHCVHFCVWRLLYVWGICSRCYLSSWFVHSHWRIVLVPFWWIRLTYSDLFQSWWTLGLFPIGGCSVLRVNTLVWSRWAYVCISAGNLPRSKTGILGMCVVSFNNYCWSSEIVVPAASVLILGFAMKRLFFFFKLSVLTSRKNHSDRDGSITVLAVPVSPWWEIKELWTSENRPGWIFTYTLTQPLTYLFFPQPQIFTVASSLLRKKKGKTESFVQSNVFVISCGQ